MSDNMAQKNSKPQQSKYQSFNPLTIVLLLLLLWIFFSWYSNQYSAPQITYSTFQEQLNQGNIDQITVQGPRIDGVLKEAAKRRVGQDKTEKYTTFTTYVPSFGDDKLLNKLENQKVEIKTKPKQKISFWYVIISTLPFVLLFGLFFYQYKKMQGQGGPGGLFSIGKSKAKLYDRSQESTTMDDVAGAEGAKTELQEIIAFLKNPEHIHDLGGEVPKGVLLVGSPGTGKTLLARAVAGESSVPFFTISGSDFMEMFVGVGAKRVRSLFEDAKKAAPSIIFIDELDSIGRRRGAGLGGGHDEREQTLNQLLSEMDGFDPKENVIVMSATNRPDILDPAIMRPGRFDRRILVDLPKTKDRKEILQVYAQNKPLAKEVSLEELARGTPGFSGADLKNVLNEATLLAARKEREVISKQDIEEARDKILMGLQRQGLALTDEEKRLIAYHEAGHAVVAAFAENADPVHKVSIVPRTQSMGVTQQLPEKEKYIYKLEYMQDRLAVMMGGRAAENLIFQTSTSGAGNDLQEATRLTRKMVLEWGMSEQFRNMALGGQTQNVFLGEEIAQRRDFSETTAREVDKEIQKILDQTYKKAEEIIQKHRPELDILVENLLQKEEISGDEVLKLFRQNK